MKELGRRNLSRPTATKKITRTDSGPYKNTTDAKNFLKQLVRSDNIPITVKNSELTRTDIPQVSV